jgi:hypothetical protein
MTRKTHLQEKPLSSSPLTPTKSCLGPRPFAPQVEEHQPPSAESLERAARFGHSFGDIDLFPRPVIQPKLRLGPVGDRYEQEADQVARRVVESISSPDQESVQRQEDLEYEDELDLEEDEELQRKVAGLAPAAGGADVGPDLESSIHRARSGGQPLSDGVRQPMERAFGADFGGVRVHTGGEADRLNRSLQAQAFTTGQDIFMRRGEYRPGSSEGQRLLAHELAHVVQQNEGVQRNAMQMIVQRSHTIIEGEKYEYEINGETHEGTSRWAISDKLDVTINIDGQEYLIPPAAIHNQELPNIGTRGNVLLGGVTVIYKNNEGEIITEYYHFGMQQYKPEKKEGLTLHSEFLYLIGHIPMVASTLSEDGVLGAIIEVRQTNTPCAACQKLIAGVLANLKARLGKPVIIRGSAERIYESQPGKLGSKLHELATKKRYSGDFGLSEERPPRMEDVHGVHLVV